MSLEDTRTTISTESPNAPVKEHIQILEQLRPEELEIKILELTNAIIERDAEAAYKIAVSLQAQKADLYHEVPNSLFPLMKQSRHIQASDPASGQYLGQMVYFGVNQMYRWVYPEPNEDQEINAVVFRKVPLKFGLPVFVKSHGAPSQFGLAVTAAVFTELKLNESESRERSLADFKLEPSNEKPMTEYKIWEAENDYVSDDNFVQQFLSNRWRHYSGNKFPTFPELTEEQLKTLDQLLTVTRVEKAYDPVMRQHRGLHYTRVYVAETCPLIACSVAAAVGAVEVVWGKTAEALQPAEMLDLLDTKRVDSLVDQIERYYNYTDIVHGRSHIITVLRNLKQLVDDEDVDLRTENLARLAVACHDLAGYGNDSAEKSAQEARKILSGLLSDADIQIITDAIIQNNRPPEARYSETMVTKLLIDADKLDWTKYRYGLNNHNDLALLHDPHAHDTDPLFPQFKVETEMILKGVYFDRTKSFLSGLIGKTTNLPDNQERSQLDQNRYNRLANMERRIKGVLRSEVPEY